MVITYEKYSFHGNHTQSYHILSTGYMYIKVISIISSKDIGKQFFFKLLIYSPSIIMKVKIN